MHELSIAQSVISIVEKSLPATFEGQVTSVILQIGTLSGIELDALEFSFSILKEKSKLKNASLLIEEIQAQAECRSCKSIFDINAYGEPCPSCQSFEYALIKGKEMKVLRINVD